MRNRSVDFETLAAHAGIGSRVEDTIATVGPIVASTTFTGESIADVHRALEPDPAGFAYARNSNPTVASLEAVVAALEGADDAVAFGSGMGAISAALTALGLGPGDMIVASSDLYGVTRSLFTQLSEYDIRTHYVDALNLDGVDRVLDDRDARALYVESISNPLLRVVDIEALSTVAARRHVPLIVDNTFATPYLCRPLELGVSVVVHSATKYLAGHGDVTAGVAAANTSWSRRIRAARTVAGSVLSPFEAWLTLRGIRTLPLRMDRQCSGALAVGEWLRGQSWIRHVYYPGLPDNPHFELAQRQFSNKFGGMLAFDLKADRTETLAFIDGLELIRSGTSLGDVESLVLYPSLSSHRTLSPEELADVGISSGLVRMSVGLESTRDLIVDLERAGRRAGLISETAVHG